MSNLIDMKLYGLSDDYMNMSVNFDEFIVSRIISQEKGVYRLVSDRGENRFDTDGLRNDDKGHHTTTHRELILLSDGSMVIDTPGMRELGMWDNSDGVDKAFAEIEEIAVHCRFRDCTHSKEPDCAICKALDDGELPLERWQSYKKLKAENAYEEDCKSYLAAKEQKFKNIAKANRKNKKIRR